MAGESPAAILFDSEGNPVLVNSEGQLFAIATRDEDQLQLLQNILKQLKLLNTHMRCVTGQRILDGDIV